METACPIRVPGLGVTRMEFGTFLEGLQEFNLFREGSLLRIPRLAMCEGLAHLLGTSRKAPPSFGEMGPDYSFRVTVSHADLWDTTFLTLTSPLP